MNQSEDDVRDLVARVVDGVLSRAEPPLERSETSAEAAVPSPGNGPVVAIGADHGGYALKEKLAFRLRETGLEVIDCGTDGPDAVDYPDIAHAVALSVADGAAQCGIIVDGAGIGSAMVANKVPRGSRRAVLRPVFGPQQPRAQPCKCSDSGRRADRRWSSVADSAGMAFSGVGHGPPRSPRRQDHSGGAVVLDWSTRSGMMDRQNLIEAVDARGPRSARSRR